MKRIIKNSVMSSASSDAQKEYEYRKKIYLKMKHEFETLGEDDDNNDVLTREEKMRIAKAEMDKMAPESVKSAKDATSKNDKRLSPTSERYKGYLIVLDRGGDGYNVYDKHRELEDAGYPSKEAAKEFIDELVANDDVYSAHSVEKVDWYELDWDEQIQLMKKYISKYKGTRIFEDFAEYIDEPVEDIIDAFSDAESRGDIRIPERMQLDSEYRNDDIYSSTTLSNRYWYFTRHGVQPGSVPKYVNILDIVDKPEGSYFLADGVILTKDLRDYDIKERKPEDSVTSSTRIEYSDYKSDRRIGVTNQRYKGYMIRLDRAGYGYNVYDKNGELEDSGYPSKEAARNFIDELVADDADTYASTDITSSTNVPETQMIDDLEYFYEVYPEAMEPILIRNGATPDKDNWLDGCNIPQAYNEAVAYFESKYDNDDEYSELDTGVGSRLGWSNYIQSGIYEETEDPKWICLDIKHVRDSDGMLTDYALYTTEDEDKYICMFGDVDVYPPDEMYADAEFDSEEEALEWFEDYTGPGDEDEDEDEDYDVYHDVIDASEELDEDEDELDHPDQEFDSADTSINSTKLPAIYKMISIPEGSVGIDFGGGKWDNAIEHIRDLGATLCVYDPYNRSKAYNKETLKTLRANGGADWAVTSNVLNVIKEPSARKAVLENISKITKSGAPIYITVYEGRGDGKAGQTKSGYQLNRKTKDYIEEIQEVFPDATRKGKLIIAHNIRSASSSTVVNCSFIW